MRINRTAISVVLPALIAMLAAMILMSRAASAQSATKPAPPAPVATPASKPSVPGPKATTTRGVTQKVIKGEQEEADTVGPFTSANSVRVIRYGRSSRAHY